MLQLKTGLGTIQGNDRKDCNEFLGVRFATASRFAYAKSVDKWDGVYDATHFGDVCPQTRAYYEHLEVPERLFYHNEFRKDITFSYSEDCLNLNIYTPKEPGSYPVLLYIHGGGFNSGANSETYLDGAEYAKRGIVLVVITYRVGILGYLTHEDIKKAYGHEGNFGLDDQLTAIKWVKHHIADFYGNPDDITLIGQSAGAISIQYLCCSPLAKGLFKGAIMMSGGGLFPKFSLPRPAESTREYWQDFMSIVGAKNLMELREMDLLTLFTGIEDIKAKRKDNTFCTMPVIDEYLIPGPIDTIIDDAFDINYMLGYTNNDMYAFLMGVIAHKYSKKHNAYLYNFDLDAKGDDDNKAFHSADLRYVFGTLERSHRPYSPHDYAISQIMIDYLANFVKTGNPNGTDFDGNPLPTWTQANGKSLHLGNDGCPVKMTRPNRLKMLYYMLTKGDPK